MWGERMKQTGTEIAAAAGEQDVCPRPAAKRKITKKTAIKYGFVGSILFYPILLFLVFFVYVNFNSFLMAFQERTFTGEVVGWVGLKNFIDFATDMVNSPLLTVALKNSLILYLAGLLVGMTLQIIFSYFLFRKFHGHTVIRFIVMLPAIISEFIVCLVFKKFIEGALPTMFETVFNIHNFPNLISDTRYTFGTVVFYSVWMSFTTSLVMYPNAMNQISDEVLESGRIDGIEIGLQELIYMVLPQIFPTISTFLITGFSAILTATGPLVAFFMLNAPQSAFTMGYYYYVEVAGSQSQVTYPYLAAGGLLMTIIVAPLTFLLKWALERFGPSQDQ